MAKTGRSRRAKVQEYVKVQPALPVELARWLNTIAASEGVTIGVIVARGLERERSATGFHVVRRAAEHRPAVVPYLEEVDLTGEPSENGIA